MDVLWIAVGIAILAFTLLDTFLAVLNYNEAGIFVNRIVRWQWVAIRASTRRVSRRWRPVLLRQVTGAFIVTTLLCWMGGLVLGFTFIYLGLIGLGMFELSDGVTRNFVGAFYLSVGQFSTAGADNISPGGGWVNLIPVAEALLSVVMLSFFITFLSNIYSVIQNLRSLCADFFQVGPGVGSPVEALRPFFPDGRPRDLDSHLSCMVNDFNLYCDSLRQDRSAYHFQSGEDQFSLPFALYMTSGVVAGLRWGLPTGHAATQSPSIVRLIEAFDGFRDSRYRLMRWRAPIARPPLSHEAFEREWEVYRSHRLDGHLDPWAARFFALDEAMSELGYASMPDEPDDPYERYVGWLAFAYPAQQFVAEVSRDLDFQPIYRDAPATPVLAWPADAGTDGTASSGPDRSRRTGGVTAWLRSRQLFLDPGAVRLRGALRTLAVVAAAVALATWFAFAFSFSVTTAGAFAGLIAMFAAPTSEWNGRLVRRAGLLGLVPVTAGITYGTLLPSDAVWTFLGLAILAAVSVWLGRFGLLTASFGRLLFIASFFASLLSVEPAEFIAAFAAGVLGVVCSWTASFLPERSPLAQLRSLTHAFAWRASALLDTAIDSLSIGTDGALERRLQDDSLALQNTGAYVMALLDTDVPPAGLSRQRTLALRLRSIDAELAVQALLRVLPSTTDYAVTVDVRSVLAGELVGLQQHIRALAADRTAVGPYTVRAEVRPDWPEGARRALAGTAELAAAFDRLHAAQHADEEHIAGADALTEPADHVRGFPRDAADSALTDRRAVQTGLSVGLALFLGGFVSTSAQYWAALPAYQSLAASDGFTWTRNLARVVSTVAGAAAAFGLALWTDHDPVVAFAVLAGTVFLTAFLRAAASSWTVFWQTVLLATVYDTVSALDTEAVDVRIAETATGAVIALIVSALVLPTRTRERMLNRMSQAVSAAMTATHAAFQRLADPGHADASALADAEAETIRQLRGIHSVARPLRGGSGSLQPGSINAQLTSLWALLYYVRRLTAAARPDAAPTITAAQWQQLDLSSRGNFQAALAVLDDRLPDRIHDVRDVMFLAGEDLSSAERELLFDVERINEVLLAYMDDVTPGSTGTHSGAD